MNARQFPKQDSLGKKNGELLRLAEDAGFDVFLTLDRGIEYEQNLKNHQIAVILPGQLIKVGR